MNFSSLEIGVDNTFGLAPTQAIEIFGGVGRKNNHLMMIGDGEFIRNYPDAPAWCVRLAALWSYSPYLGTSLSFVAHGEWINFSGDPGALCVDRRVYRLASPKMRSLRPFGGQ